MLDNVDFIKLFYSVLAIFFTVVVVLLIKLYANIDVKLITIGTDLNLFTYGFLFDIMFKALIEEPFWERYSWVISKNLFVFLIFTANSLLMMVNFKLEHYITSLGSSYPSHVNWVHKPGVLILGLVSLSIYLATNSMLG